MLGTALADVDSLRIASDKIENLRRDQRVVQDHIALLHQAQRTKGQQVRIARTCSHQVNLAAGLGAFEQAFNLENRRHFVTSEQALRSGAVQKVFPQLAACIDRQLLDPLAMTLHESRNATIGRREQGFDAFPQTACKHRRCAAGGNGNRDRRTHHHGWRDKATDLCVVYDVAEQSFSLRTLRHMLIEYSIVTRGDNQSALRQLGF